MAGSLCGKSQQKQFKKYPVTGTGLGGFPAAYAEAQAEYMTSGKASEQEKWIAGCPEYAFNEYLQIGLEQGIIGLALFMTCLGSIVYKGIKNKKICLLWRNHSVGYICFLIVSVTIAGVLGHIDIFGSDVRNTESGSNSKG